MPTYPYACTECGHQFEKHQSFSDDPLTTCPECGGKLRKVWGSVGVVFKGSGFYRNDSRSSAKAGSNGSGDAAGSSSGSGSASTESASSSTSSSKPSSASSTATSSSSGSSSSGAA